MNLMNNLTAVMQDSTLDSDLVDYLDFLASKTSVESITNFHVFTATHLYDHLNKNGGNSGDTLIEAIKEKMEKQLKDAYKNIAETKAEVVVGSVLSELQRKGKSSNSDLMVLGKHSKSDATLAKQIIRHIPCNELIVPENAKQTLSHILVPVDLSKHSAKVLDIAIKLKQSLGENVKITCYHSFEMPNTSSFSLFKNNELHEIIKKNNYDALHKFIDENTGDSRSQIEEIVQDQIANRPDRSILNYIENNNIDFLIMGAKGHSTLDSAFIGSTVERVISKNNTAPMLIIK